MKRLLTLTGPRYCLKVLAKVLSQESVKIICQKAKLATDDTFVIKRGSKNNLTEPKTNNGLEAIIESGKTSNYLR